MKATVLSLALFLMVFPLVCSIEGAEKTGMASFPEINGNAVLEHTKILSSDEFEGRGPGTDGEKKTVNYIIEKFEEVGLKPGITDGTFVQAAPRRNHCGSGYDLDVQERKTAT